MIVRVRLFALAAQLARADVVEVPVDGSQTVAELRRELAIRCPALQDLLPHLIFAVNAEYATDNTPVLAGAEVACIPPVSGG